MSETQVKQQVQSDSRWAPKNVSKPGESDQSNGRNSKSSSRGKRGGRARAFNPRRVPRGRVHKDSGDEDESPRADEGDTSRKNGTKAADQKKTSRESTANPNQSASSQSENSEDDDDDDDDDDEDEDEEEEEEEGHKAENNKNPIEEDKRHQNGHQQAEEIDATKHKDVRNQEPERQKEPQPKPHSKRQPYVRQVELPKEKLSAADLEAKMAAMALKNAQLMEQKKAADQDAAEYREIELKSQQALEAQRDQQKEIDAVRQLAAERKLKKSQGREWDVEKSEEDWNRSRPYIDSMTNPNPGKNSWYTSRGSGYRGRPRGSHNSERGRGRGRGSKRGGRGSWQGRGNEHAETESPDRSQAPADWNDQDHAPSSNTQQNGKSNSESNTNANTDWHTQSNAESKNEWYTQTNAESNTDANAGSN